MSCPNCIGEVILQYHEACSQHLCMGGPYLLGTPSLCKKLTAGTFSLAFTIVHCVLFLRILYSWKWWLLCAYNKSEQASSALRLAAVITAYVTFRCGVFCPRFAVDQELSKFCPRRRRPDSSKVSVLTANGRFLFFFHYFIYLKKNEDWGSATRKNLFYLMGNSGFV